jgi:hypothetical protein
MTVVTDDQAMFITLANFARAALDRNIEIGLLIHDCTLAASLICHFRGVIDLGLLVLLPNDWRIDEADDTSVIMPQTYQARPRCSGPRASQAAVPAWWWNYSTSQAESRKGCAILRRKIILAAEPTDILVWLNDWFEQKIVGEDHHRFIPLSFNNEILGDFPVSDLVNEYAKKYMPNLLPIPEEALDKNAARQFITEQFSLMGEFSKVQINQKQLSLRDQAENPIERH